MPIVNTPEGGAPRKYGPRVRAVQREESRDRRESRLLYLLDEALAAVRIAEREGDIAALPDLREAAEEARRRYDEMRRSN